MDTALDRDISSSEEEIQKSKKKNRKSKSKSKKHSKEKKHKKRRRRNRSSSSEESSEEEEWIAKEEVIADVKGAAADPEKVSVNSKESEVCAPVLERDEWMTMESLIPTYSNVSKRAKRQAEKDEEKKRNSIDSLGQHAKELNPFWKDGGTGLPSEESQSQTATSKPTIGDGGLGWLKKAYQRAKEQAKDENRSLEEIATERWGSLENFYSMLEEAEEKAKSLSSSRRHGDFHSSDRRQNDPYKSRPSKDFRRPGRDSDEERRDDYRSSRSDRSQSSASRTSSSRHHRRDQAPSWKKRSTENTSNSSSVNDKIHRKSRSKSPRSPRLRRPKSRSPPRKHTRSRSKSQSPKREGLNTSSRSLDIEKSDNMPDEEEGVIEPPKVLTDKEMNEIGAKIIKAEMLGNTVMLEELRKRFQDAEAARQDFIKSGGTPGTNATKGPKVITRVIMGSDSGGGGRGRRVKDKPSETHKDGQRVRYFPDDDKYTLQNMFEKEKLNTVEDENALFSRLAGKGMKTNAEYDMDDVFADTASSSKKDHKDKEREVRKAIDDDSQYKKTLEDCQWCFDGKYLQKNLVISIGEKSILCVPPFQSLIEGHCLIVPMFHVPCATELDEDVWEEMQKFRRSIVKMFRDADQDVVIYETALFLKKHPHMYLECVPMPKETGELAPIYFKKAIQECETEWSQNKKLVDLRDRDVRRAVPKGLPYFSVDFGIDSGFAHVVEDERNFPRNFAQEIIGGMMELPHELWRKQKKDDFKTQRAKVMTFLKSWGPYDWTRDPN